MYANVPPVLWSTPTTARKESRQMRVPRQQRDEAIGNGPFQAWGHRLRETQKLGRSNRRRTAEKNKTRQRRTRHMV